MLTTYLYGNTLMLGQQTQTKAAIKVSIGITLEFRLNSYLETLNGWDFGS